MRGLVAALLVALALPAGAVEPDEMLDDPRLEERAREISKEVRCLVCQNESIDDSNADLARDLRLVVRERIVAGDTNDQVRDFLVNRYGEFVLLKPRFTMENAVIWLSGPILLVIGAIASLVYIRGRRKAVSAEAPLTPEERDELDRILNARRE
jgi:cytochrome c-type biogenesis protein CcmH